VIGDTDRLRSAGLASLQPPAGARDGAHLTPR
jgi:hypothetical protein